MDDAIAGITTSTNDFEFWCDVAMLVAMVTDFHRPILNRHSALLCSSVLVDAVSNGGCQVDGDLTVDPNRVDLDNLGRKNRLVPRYFYSRWKKSKFHSYNNETQWFR